jgi:D-xylose transport system permease protein
MSETAEKSAFKIETSALRAYTMLGAMVLIWFFFHYATAENTPEFFQYFKKSETSFIITLKNALALHIQHFFSFAWIPEGIFLTPRNLSNLMLQMSVTGILAVGMLMVIVSGNIDLSIGSILGLSGGVAAILMYHYDYGIIPAIIAAIIVAVLIGIFQGFLIAYFTIPAFIVTLGGLLAWRGAIKGISNSETVPVSDETFKLIGQGNLTLASGWVLAGIAIVFLLFLAYRRAQSQKIYGLGEAKTGGEILKIIIPVGAILGFIYVMNVADGVPLPVLIFLIVALIGTFITNATVFGRYLYAIGGNADAARLSGINTKLNILKVYALLGLLIGVAAIIFTARQGNALPNAGVLKELDAIAACVIGGASLMGGRGTIFGACLGALIMASLDNGMSLLNVRDFMQELIKGTILVAAVGADMIGKKS